MKWSVAAAAAGQELSLRRDGDFRAAFSIFIQFTAAFISTESTGRSRESTANRVLHL